MDSFSIDVEATVPWSAKDEFWASVSYGFEISAASRRGRRSFEVLRETGEQPQWHTAARSHPSSAGSAVPGP
jgi:hypothetical protein